MKSSFYIWDKIQPSFSLWGVEGIGSVNAMIGVTCFLDGLTLQLPPHWQQGPWPYSSETHGQTGRRHSVLGAMKNNFLPKMGPRGTGLAQSRGVWAMQQEFQGRVTENVRGKCQRQTAASGCCTLDLFTQCLIKLHHEGIQRLECSMSQTSGTKPLMYHADSSASQCLTLT